MADEIFGQGLAAQPLIAVQTPAVIPAFEADPKPVYFAGGLPTKAAVTALTAIATADATDLPTAIALANANKAKINAIIAALKS